MTNYTFSVVATNSIGSGEAGVVMITTPGMYFTVHYVYAHTYVHTVPLNYNFIFTRVLPRSISHVKCQSFPWYSVFL